MMSNTTTNRRRRMVLEAAQAAASERTRIERYVGLRSRLMAQGFDRKRAAMIAQGDVFGSR